MKPCKEKLPDGKSCPNQVDEGQEYCPYHLAKQVAEERKQISFTLAALGLTNLVGTVVKGVARIKRL